MKFILNILIHGTIEVFLFKVKAAIIIIIIIIMIITIILKVQSDPVNYQYQRGKKTVGG